tara:strand:- start:34430 stop:35014 length:585 start_codon:yes stop_codon:yes gene_type:complete
MKDKEFIKNRGLYFGIYLSIFPFFYFLFDNNLSLNIFKLVFWVLWIIGVFYLLYIFGKEYRNNYNLFNFKQVFTLLYKISLRGLLILFVIEIILWKGLFEERYISLQTSLMQPSLNGIESIKSELKKDSADKIIGIEEYQEKLEKLEKYKTDINDQWKDGVKITYFIKILIGRLFLFIFINLILAFFLRKKIVI